MKLTYSHTMKSCYLAYVTQAIINNLAPLLFVTFNEQFGITYNELALLVVFNFATQIMVDIIGIKFIDKIGYRKSVVIASAAAASGLILMGILPVTMKSAYVGLVISVFIYAVGSGLIEVIVSPIIEAIPSDSKSSNMSVLHSFYCWGHVAVVILSTLYFVTAGIENWRFLPMLWAIVPLMSLVLFCVVPIRQLNDEIPSLPVRKLFSYKIFWVFIILMVCAGAAEQAMSQWASLFAEKGLGISKSLGDLLGPCLFAIMMGISRVAYWKIADKISLVKVLIISSAIAVLGYLTVSLVSNPYLALVGCGVVGFGVGMFWPGTYSVASKRIPAGGTAMFAILAMAGDAGCSVGPQLAAVVSSIPGLTLKNGLLVCVIFPLIIFVTCFNLFRKQRENNPPK